jgi:hypothetical protein
VSLSISGPNENVERNGWAIEHRTHGHKSCEGQQLTGPNKLQNYSWHLLLYQQSNCIVTRKIFLDLSKCLFYHSQQKSFFLPRQLPQCIYSHRHCSTQQEHRLDLIGYLTNHISICSWIDAICIEKNNVQNSTYERASLLSTHYNWIPIPNFRMALVTILEKLDWKTRT